MILGLLIAGCMLAPLDQDVAIHVTEACMVLLTTLWLARGVAEQVNGWHP